MNLQAKGAATRRRVAVFTGGRAEYGLLRPLVRELSGRPGLDIGLFVSGTHLSREFGYTVTEVEGDGFPVWQRIESQMSGDSPAAVCRSMAMACVGVSDALDRHRPDLMVLLGDRYELLGAGQAAMIHTVPLAHLHGGEATEGLVDECIRHALTKMSHLHFVAAEPYRRRVVQMGEDPARVFATGALGLDAIHQTDPMPRQQLEDELGIRLTSPVFLVTYHPVTLLDTSPRLAVEALTSALGAFDGGSFIITYPNSDTAGREIIAPMKAFIAANPDRAVMTPSLGSRRYLSVMRLADVVVGNSSSGIIEAPSFGIGTVNLGLRQQGRLRADSIIDCVERRDDIEAALHAALDPAFRERVSNVDNPYGDGHAAARIADVVERVNLDAILMKSFRDST